MSETNKKKKKQSLEKISEFDALVIESVRDRSIEEIKLKAARARMAERDLAVEGFLKKEKGSLKRYNERRKMHYEAELMPEKEIIEEKW